MSASSTTSDGRQYLERHARKIFVDLNLAHIELFADDVWNRVLELVRQRQYFYLEIAKMAKAADKIGQQAVRVVDRRYN